MTTSKPFSLIGYTTEDFLSCKLSDYVKRGVLQFYAYIKHYAEDDEGKKDHYHIWCLPAERIDLSAFCNDLVEFDPAHPDKPLRCLLPRSSKVGDWYLYALHDTAYLLAHGQQSRRYTYLDDDFKVSDPDLWAEIKHTADFSKYARQQMFVNAVRAKVPFGQILEDGLVPFQQASSYKQAYEAIRRFETWRTGISHEVPDVVVERCVDDEESPFSTDIT